MIMLAPSSRALVVMQPQFTRVDGASIVMKSCEVLGILRSLGLAEGQLRTAAPAHRFRDTFSVELLLAGVPIERVAILLGHQSVRITEKHYAPWVRARQEQLEADVRRTWQTHEPQQGVHGGYTENDARVIPFKSRRKNGGGGGSRTPVRKALRHEDYMLSSVQFVSPAALRMSKKRNKLV